MANSLAQCKKQINSLKQRINLKKLNHLYGKYVNHRDPDDDSEEKEPMNFPPKLRPKAHFPIQSVNKNGNKKGDAKFNMQKCLRGHNDKIYTLKWSKDNKHLVSGSKDGSLIIWDMTQYTQILGIPLRNRWVMTVDYSPNSKLIASGGYDGVCSVFDTQDKSGWAVEMIRPHRELHQHESYISCNRFVDNEHILTASGDSSCILWDIEYQQPIQCFNGHTGDVMCIEHNYDTNNTFISGSCDMSAKIWDYRLKSYESCIKTFIGHISDINCVKWFPDYKSFATASDDGCCRLFDIPSSHTLNIYGNISKDIDNIDSNNVTYIDFSKSGYYLAAAYDEGQHCIAWNTVTAEPEKHIPHSQRVSCLEFQPNGNSLVTVSWDRNLRVWV